MDDDDYEIIYEKGVPVIAFQICSSEEEKEVEVDNPIPPQSHNDFEEYQTLQYFKEDEIQKGTGQFGSACQKARIPQSHPNELENKKCKRSNKSHKNEGNMDFVIIENTTKCNSKKLYDSQGYSYTLRSMSVKEGCSVWRCRFKIDGKECGANIKITNDEQMVIVKTHRHLPDRPISFALLKNSSKNPMKYRMKQTSSVVLRGQSNAQNSLRAVEPKEQKHFMKKKYEECDDKMLDYFSEGQMMEISDNLDILLDEQDEGNDSLFEDESLLTPVAAKEKKVVFKVVKNGSITGTHILYDSLGYSYSLVQRKGVQTFWCCQAAVHSTDEKECQVKVSQNGSEFITLGDHTHSPKRHTLLKINKMKIFSTEDEMVPEKLVKRNILQKVVPATKKAKHDKDSSDHCLLTVQNVKKEENDESFEFSSKDISFTVSLEKEDIAAEGDSEEETVDGVSNQSFIATERKKRHSGQVLLSRTVPNMYQEETYSLLREMAARVFSTDQTHLLNDIDYHVIENGSSQGGPKLYDSRGYFYTVRNNTIPTDIGTETKTNWFCCSRGEKHSCRAKVMQTMSCFTLEREHCHPPNKEKYIRSLIRMEAVEMIKDPYNLRRSGMSIVKGIIDSYGFDLPFNINVDHLVRFVNYQKKSFMEHNEIASCRYTFNKKKIPKNFLLDKIMSDYKYHLTFATENQLAYLAAATEWYIDEADFDVAPFTNLFSIHIYTQQQDQPRQIPVFFALISDRQESDYVQVFASIKESLNKPPAVASVIIDLNVPLRKSLAKSFPSSEIKCCDLHWSEDISNKLKEMDLSSFYDHPVAMNYLYQLPLLNLLPRQIFETALRKIEDEVKDVSVQDLICYIRETFGERSLWPPKYWSSFKMPIQINDHEQWRKDILSQSASQLEIYSFIRNLHMLSESVGDDIRLMSKKKIKKFYLSRPETTLCKVYKEWKSYCKGEKDCHKLLEKLASVIHVF